MIAAHPDDEVLGCGGSMPLWVERGDELYIAILGEGITSRFQQRASAGSESLGRLSDDARRVAALLGAEKLDLKSLPDNRFDSIPLLDVVKIIEDLIEAVKPNAIYTHHGGDLNVDHCVVSRAVITATRPSAESSVRELYAFEVPSSTEWSFQRFEPSFRPNVFQDITKTLPVKIQAMEMYGSEARSFPHPRSPESLRAIATRWGTVVGRPAAEAFEVIRCIR